MEAYETRTFYSSVYTEEVCGAQVQEAPQEAPQEAADQSDSEDDGTDGPAEVLDSHQFYSRFVARTRQECIDELEAPQRSLKWLEARKYAITASIFGSAAGNNKYSSPKALVLDKLWNSFKGNTFTQFGTFHEPDARKSFEGLIQGELRKTLDSIHGSDNYSYELYETGLIKHHDQPWMAVSPDGILKLKSKERTTYIVVEYKCPARLRDCDEHPYSKSPNNVPEYYMDQVQGIMGLFNKFPDLLQSKAIEGPTESQTEGQINCQIEEQNTLQWAFFVVWQKHQFHVTLVPYQKNYYELDLEPKLRNWFFQEYLPYAVLKHNGLLIENTMTTAPTIYL